jgi:hypothetical protein
VFFVPTKDRDAPFRPLSNVTDNTVSHRGPRSFKENRQPSDTVTLRNETLRSKDNFMNKTIRCAVSTQFVSSSMEIQTNCLLIADQSTFT